MAVTRNDPTRKQGRFNPPGIAPRFLRIASVAVRRLGGVVSSRSDPRHRSLGSWRHRKGVRMTRGPLAVARRVYQRGVSPLLRPC
jgi:hypothetical protein